MGDLDGVVNLIDSLNLRADEMRTLLAEGLDVTRLAFPDDPDSEHKPAKNGLGDPICWGCEAPWPCRIGSWRERVQAWQANHG